MITVNIFGNNLIMLRKKRMITQTQLADVIGVTKQAISAYESGSRQPAYDILGRLADFFHVTTDYLLGRQPELLIDATGLDAEDYNMMVTLAERLKDKRR